MKQIFALLLTLTLLLCLCACGGGTSQNSPEGTNPPAQENPPAGGTPPTSSAEDTALSEIRALVEIPYASIILDIQETAYGFVLNSKYVIEKESVSYSAERLNLLPEDGNFNALSPNYKTVFTGTGKIENGVITELDGSAIVLPSAEMLQGKFTFNKNCLSEINAQSGHLSASVTAPDVLLGRATRAQNMKIDVIYTESAIQEILLEYDLGDAHILTKYAFQK